MSIAAEGGSAPPTVPDAAARVLEFTKVARPGDLPLVLNALSAAELTAGTARLRPRLPAAVIDHVIAHGPRVARNTLAWQLRLPPRPPAVRLDFFRSPAAVREHAVQRAGLGRRGARGRRGGERGSVHAFVDVDRRNPAAGDRRRTRRATASARSHRPGSGPLSGPAPRRSVVLALENAVRQHLDNDPHRGRIMVRRLMEAGPLEYAQLVDLVEAVGDGAGEAAEGES